MMGRERAGRAGRSLVAEARPPVRRDGFLGFVAEHRIAAFVVLAYALSWWTVPFIDSPLGSGPFLAALLLLGLLEGRSGIVALLRQMVQWRMPGKFYAAALLLPAVASLFSIVIAVGLGAPNPIDAALSSWTVIPIEFATVLLLPLLGPREEPGFRGFALSGLMTRRSPLVAGLTVGAIHVGWHIPLFFSGDIPAADVVLILAASVVLAWLVVRSGGSVLIAMLMHASSNAFSGEFASKLFSGSDVALLGWVRALLWCVIAAGIIAATGPWFRQKPTAAQA